MGRQRLPQPKSSTYITPNGMERLRAELDHLWRVKRPQVTQAVADAAALGDRSENAEYLYGKKQLREIDRRVHYLRKRLDELIVVDRPPSDPSRVFFGAWVEVENAAGEVSRYRLVGPDETDADKGYISIDAPLARALLKIGRRRGRCGTAARSHRTYYSLGPLRGAELQLSFGIAQAPVDDACGRRIAVRVRTRRGYDMANLNATHRKVIGDQRPMALPPYRLGAHDRSRPLTGNVK
jgi:transcription elongation factor GreB